MISRAISAWTDYTTGEKVFMTFAAPVALSTGFVVGLIATVYLLTSPLFGA